MEFIELTDDQRRQILDAIAGNYFDADCQFTAHSLHLLTALYDPESGYALTRHYYVSPLVTRDAAENGYLLLKADTVRMICGEDCPEAFRPLISAYEAGGRERDDLESRLLAEYALTAVDGEPVRTAHDYFVWYRSRYQPKKPPVTALQPPAPPENPPAPKEEPVPEPEKQPENDLNRLLGALRSGRSSMKRTALTAALILILSGMLVMLLPFLIRCGIL